MTRDEILNMPAGKEMDAEIAKIIGSVPCDKWRLQRTTEFGSIYFRDDNCGHDKCYPTEQPRKYSTDIAAAWEVVEKLHELDWALTLDDMRHDKDNSGWWYELSRFEGAKLGDIEHEFPTHYHTLDGMGDTAQLAICRAALLAVMENK